MPAAPGRARAPASALSASRSARCTPISRAFDCRRTPPPASVCPAPSGARRRYISSGPSPRAGPGSGRRAPALPAQGRCGGLDRLGPPAPSTRPSCITVKPSVIRLELVGGGSLCGSRRSAPRSELARKAAAARPSARSDLCSVRPHLRSRSSGALSFCVSGAGLRARIVAIRSCVVCRSRTGFSRLLRARSRLEIAFRLLASASADSTSAPSSTANLLELGRRASAYCPARSDYLASRSRGRAHSMELAASQQAPGASGLRRAEGAVGG